MIGKKCWKKISKDEQNEEENLGVREPVRLAPKKYISACVWIQELSIPNNFEDPVFQTEYWLLQYHYEKSTR